MIRLYNTYNMSYSKKIAHIGATTALLFLMSGLFLFNAEYALADARSDCLGEGRTWDSSTGICQPKDGGGSAGGGVGTGLSGPIGTGLSGSDGSGKITNPLKSKDIPEFLLKIIDVLLVFALPLIILYIMYAGYLFVTAAGNAEKVSSAKNALLWSVVGGVIVLGARLIISVIQGTITAF